MTYKCKYCFVDFSNPKKIASHTAHCKSNPNHHSIKLKRIQAGKRSGQINNNKNPIINKNVLCNFCNKEFIIKERTIPPKRRKNYYCNKACSSNYSRKFVDYNKVRESLFDHFSEKTGIDRGNYKNKIKPFKRKCKDVTCSIIVVYSDYCVKHTPRKKWTPEQKLKHSLLLKAKSLKNPGSIGGYRPGSGRKNWFKKGWYKDYWCDSSWELAFVVYNLENCIDIKRNKEAFKYKSPIDNKIHLFTPDFMIGTTYYEIKGGYETLEVTKAKLEYFPFEIELIDHSKIYNYINYCKNKYGKNFADVLYELNSHNPN